MSDHNLPDDQLDKENIALASSVNAFIHGGYSKLPLADESIVNDAMNKFVQDMLTLMDVDKNTSSSSFEDELSVAMFGMVPFLMLTISPEHLLVFADSEVGQAIIARVIEETKSPGKTPGSEISPEGIINNRINLARKQIAG